MNKKKNTGYLSSIHYGGGKVGVLLFHSLGGTPMELKFLAQGIARNGYTVSCPMLPGMANGTDVLSLSRWQDWYAEADKAFDELKAKCDTVLIGGLSAGSIVAMRLAQQRSNEVEGLLVFAPTLWPNGWAIPWYFNFYRLVTQRWFARMFRFKQREPHGIKDERVRNFMIEAFKGSGPGVEQAYARSGVMVLEFHRLVKAVKRNLGACTAPAIIVHPRHDDQSNLSNTLVLQKDLGGYVETIVLDDSYHMVTLDRQRDIVMERAVDFVQRMLARRDQQRARVGSVGVADAVQAGAAE
ncbi:alpha/beta fold hydrolase [Filomicrobium sp.]|uniref:alpha/beta hydrolase n=1 Tax=Filomicrobium sp. TaxID=2024831 RepID=UPI002586306D|nr:alpha/beta fold hydrolase [Filomicrobium sp.]MCV0369171.1 alpha/beta fold hydrolase [Filomicrobium sp.]